MTVPETILIAEGLNILQYQIAMSFYDRKCAPGAHLITRVAVPFWNMDSYLCCIVKGLNDMCQNGTGHIGSGECARCRGSTVLCVGGKVWSHKFL